MHTSSPLISEQIQLRRNLLDFLYQNFKRSQVYVEGEDIIRTIKADKSDIYANLRYLEDKNLVQIIWRTGGFPVAKITSAGIDLIEDESEFNRKFPVSFNYDASVHIGNVAGDAIGIGVTGSENAIGKNISINKQQLNSMHKEYSDSLKAFMEQITKYKIPRENIKPVEDSINDLTKEIEGIRPEEKTSIVRQKVLNSKFSVFVDKALKALPKTTEVLSSFTPLAPFSKLIGEQVESLVNAIRSQT